MGELGTGRCGRIVECMYNVIFPLVSATTCIARQLCTSGSRNRVASPGCIEIQGLTTYTAPTNVSRA